MPWELYLYLYLFCYLFRESLTKFPWLLLNLPPSLVAGTTSPGVLSGSAGPISLETRFSMHDRYLVIDLFTEQAFTEGILLAVGATLKFKKS